MRDFLSLLMLEEHSTQPKYVASTTTNSACNIISKSNAMKIIIFSHHCSGLSYFVLLFTSFGE